jgi:hypothetical protein
MGLVDDKRNIFTEIAALRAIAEGANIPDPSAILASINNGRDILRLLLDILITVVGIEVLKLLIGEIISKFVRTSEDSLKRTLKNQTKDFDSDQDLPPDFETNGVRVPVSDIDAEGDLRVDPNSELGEVSYGGGDSFDRAVRQAIESPNTEIPTGDVTVEYDPTTDEIIIRGNGSQSKVGAFTDAFIDNLTLIAEAVIIAKVMDTLFGTSTGEKNKTKSQLVEEEKIKRTLQKAIDQEEDLEIDDDELRDIEQTAEDALNGVNSLDIGCQILDTSLPFSGVTELIATVTGSTDPTTIGNAFDKTLNDSFDPTAEDQRDENKQAITEGFFSTLIAALVLALVGAISTSPQVKILFGMIGVFRTGVAQIGDTVQFIRENRNLIDCLIQELVGQLHEFIFEIVKRELLKIVIAITVIIIREKINQFIGLLRSLIRRPAAS